MKTEHEQSVNDLFISELKDLDKEAILLENGVSMKPSQCYSFSLYPKPHFLYNTNCSDELKNKLLKIFRKYFNESV